MAAAAPTAQSVAFCDSRGRYLKSSATAPLACTDGVATEGALLRLVRFSSDSDEPEGAQPAAALYVLLQPDGGFVGPAPFAPVASKERAQRFECESVQDGAVAFRLHGGGCGGAEYLAATEQGGLAPSSERCAFTVIVAPVLGSVTVAHALRSMHGQRVSLWGGPERGWVCPHPPKLFGGGQVKSRVPKMGQWEVFTLQVRDASAGLVALQSSFGRWLAHLPSGELVADRKDVNAWETFTLAQHSAAEVTLSSSAHNGRVTFVSAAVESMHARALTPGPAERFVLLDAGEAHRRYMDTNPAFLVPAADPAKRLSPLAIAGIVAGSLLGAAALAGGIAATVIAVQEVKRREESEREAARAAKVAAAAAAEHAEREAAAKEDVRVRLEAETAARTALAALRERPGDAGAVKGACLALVEAAGCPSGRQAAVGGGGPQAIVGAMRPHAADAGVVVAAVAALAALATTSPAQLACVAAGAVDDLTAALRAFPAVCDVTDPALELLEGLCDGITEAQDACARAGTAAAVAGVLRQHPSASSPDGQLACLGALRSIVYDHDAGVLAAVQQASGVLRAVSGVLTPTPPRADVAADALQLLAELTRHGNAVKHCVGPAGGVAALVVQVLASPLAAAHADVATPCATVLGYNLCWDNFWATTKAPLLAADAPAAVAAAMALHPRSQLFQRNCCKALAQFAPLAEARAACLTAAPHVLRAMAAFSGDKDVVDSGTEVLLPLAKERIVRRAARGTVPALYRQMLATLGALPGDTDALLAAAYQGDLAEAHELLDRGVKVASREKKRHVAHAAGGGTGGHYESTTAWVGTALHIAARHGHVEIVEALLAHGADVDEEAPFTAYAGGDVGVCGTPLHAAVHGGQVRAVTLLRQHGAVVDDQARALAQGREDVLAALSAELPKEEDAGDE